MKKRILSLVLAVLMIATLLPTPAFADETATSGTCGENLTWTLVDGVLTISGTGEMDDYDAWRPWNDYAEEPITNVNSIIVEEGVTSIGEEAFSSCTNLEQVTLSSTVKSIGYFAFYDCPMLKSITIPAGVESIANCAFSDCSSLTEIIVDENNEQYVSVDGVLFSKDMTTLVAYPAGIKAEAYEIPSSVIDISAKAFAGCENLKDITIPDGVENIGWSAFSRCMNLKSIVVPDSVKSIEDIAFFECYSLESITLPDTLTTIENSTFAYCTSLESITLPNSITNIGYDAFDECLSLNDVYYLGTIEQWEAINIESGNGRLLTAKIHCDDGDVIPHGTCGENVTWKYADGTLTISGTGDMTNYSSASGAPWYDLSGSIVKVVVEDGVTSVGDKAFLYYYNLEDVTLSDSVTDIGENAFNNCSELKSIAIPKGVRNISYCAFYYCDSLESVSFPTGLKSIGDSAFENCNALSDANYGGTVEQWNAVTIGCGNDRLKKLAIHCSDGDVIKCGDKLSWKLENGILTISGEGDMYDYSWDDTPWYDLSEEITSVIIENGVTSIGTNAFEHLFNLKSVTLPKELTTIGSYAFSYCTDLDDVYYSGTAEQWEAINVENNNSWLLASNIHCTDGDILPHGSCGDNLTWSLTDGVLTISGTGDMDDYGWDDAPWRGKADSIVEAKIPYGVTSIGENAFLELWNLDDVYYSGTAAQWDEISIGNANSWLLTANIHCKDGDVTPHGSCGENLTWTLANGVLTISGIGNMADYDGENTPWYAKYDLIVSVKIEKGVTSIGNYAFFNCRHISDVYYSGTVNQWETISIGYGNDNLNMATVHCTDGDVLPHGSCGEDLTWTLADGVLTISGTGAMEDYGWDSDAPWYLNNSIKKVVIENGVTSVGNYAFWGCSSLESITLPNSLKSIGDGAFTYCDSVYEVNFGGTVEQWNTVMIGEDNEVIKKLTIHCSDGDISKCGDNLTWKFEDGVLTISGEGDMYNYGWNNTPWKDLREEITSVVIENGVTSIGDLAFAYCVNLESIALPKGVLSIGDWAFVFCISLNTVNIPDTVQTIGALAFLECGLDDIYIPDGVLSINEGAFNGCNNLKAINVSDNNPDYSSIDGVLFNKDKTAMLIYPAGCDAETYSVPNGIAEISYGTFGDCTKLKTLNIPDSVTKIADDALIWAYGLEAINVNENNSNYSSLNGILFNKDKTVLLQCPISYEAEDYTMPSSVKQVKDNAFWGCTNLQSITWPSQIESICIDSYFDCRNLKTMYVPASVKEFTKNDQYDYDYTFSGTIYYEGTPEQWNEILQTELVSDATVYYNYSNKHQFGEWKVVKAATCTANGTEERTCSHCDMVETRDIPATGHDYKAVVTAPTCTEKGYTTHTCAACGDSYIDSYTDALGHDYGAWKQTKAPTCTAKGTETRTCSRCNATETRDVAALGHDIKHHEAKAATCTEKGWTAYDTCSRCDYSTYKEIASTGHKYTTAVTAPTCTAQGYTTHTCSACGNSYKDSYTNALGHNYKTGKCTRCGAVDPNYIVAPELKITTSAGKPKISWNAVDGAAKYWVYRSTDGKTLKYYDSTTKTSYTNNSTTIGTTYYYKVKAVKVVDGNNYASDFSVSKSIQCKPAAPTLSINRSNGKPKLSWKAVSGAKKYWVYRSTDGVNFKYWDSTTKTTYTNKGAASGTKYYYRVKAVAVVNGNNIASANSSTKSLMTTLAKPSVSITTSGGKPKLTWNAVTGADKYYIYRSTDGKNFKYWESTTKTFYVNTGAKKNTRYYYKVKAVCASNSYANSAQSSTVSIKATK